MTTPTANEEWIDDLVDNVVSDIQRSGWCDRVNEYEPTRKPGHGITAAVWAQHIGPTVVSGLASTSAVVVVMVRLYKPLPIGQAKVPASMDMIDRRLLKAASNIVRRYHDDFDFGGTIRNVDLLGSRGQALEGEAGYIEIDKVLHRVITITVPCIVNDVWPQVT
jgi:hypothetical protein